MLICARVKGDCYWSNNCSQYGCGPFFVIRNISKSTTFFYELHSYRPLKRRHKMFKTDKWSHEPLDDSVVSLQSFGHFMESVLWSTGMYKSVHGQSVFVFAQRGLYFLRVGFVNNICKT